MTAAARPATLALCALALGILALVLSVFPRVGLAAAIVATVVSIVAWRRAHETGRNLGLAQTAAGLALSVLAISTVWTVVAATLPKDTRPTLDCSVRPLSPADQVTCRETVRP